MRPGSQSPTGALPKLGAARPSATGVRVRPPAVVPILMSPTLRTNACTRGGGATTAVLGTVTSTLRGNRSQAPGRGATPEACSRPEAARSPLADLGRRGNDRSRTWARGQSRRSAGSRKRHRRRHHVRSYNIGSPGPFSLMSGALTSAWARSGATRIEPRRADSTGFRGHPAYPRRVAA